MRTPKVGNRLWGYFFMTKISINTKLKAVEEYANGNDSKEFIRKNTGSPNLIFKSVWEFMQDLVRKHYLIHRR